MARKYRSLPHWALVLCLGISPASGQTPAPAPPALAIDGPATVPVYSLGSYAVTGDPLAKVAWLIVPSTSQVSSGQHFTMTGQPGKYLVIAFAVSGGQPVILEQVVTISGTAPTPTPDPVTVAPADTRAGTCPGTINDRALPRCVCHRRESRHGDVGRASRTAKLNHDEGLIGSHGIRQSVAIACGCCKPGYRALRASGSPCGYAVRAHHPE
jgi:hypothetical protein